jgi:hypothetical protein
VPSGPDFRFTSAEWDSLGDKLPVEEWEAGFLVPPPAGAKVEGSPGKHGSFERVVRKENLSAVWKGKEKERAATAVAVEDDALRMAY